MTDLVLRTRLETLKANLKQVESVLESVRDWRDEIGAMLALLTDLRQDVRSYAWSVQRRINAAVADLENGRDRTIVLDDLRKANEEVSEILTHLDALKDSDKVFRSMQTRFVEIKRDEDLGRTLLLYLVGKARDSMSTLEEICATQVREAARREREGDRAAAETLREEAWDHLRSVHQTSESVFAEYIDFLRGLALRDTGFDAGICQIADELIRGCEMVPDIPRWESFTIPARNEAVNVDLARIIRLGFPEWTIWALPLTAHGFGYMAACKNDELRRYVEDQSGDELTRRHLREYLADAFATYAMGPAYACAAILLRFDPLSAYTDAKERPAADKRVHVVLTMLEWMDRKAAETSPYARIIAELRTEWDAALQHAKPPGPPEPWDKEELESLVSFLGTFLRSGFVEYDIKSWASIQEWPAGLLQNQVEAIELSGRETLRDVLNAAWLGRIQEPTSAEQIGRAALELWKRVEAGPKPSGKRVGPGWTGRGG